MELQTATTTRQPTIKVIDAIMGQGKTTYLLSMIRQTVAEDRRQRWLVSPEHSPTKFLVVVPLLSEVDRVATALPDLDFRDPQPVHGRKLYHLGKLIDEGANIVTTHSLFKLLDRAIYAKLRASNYVLIVDEVLDTVDLYGGLTAKDRDLLLSQRMVSIHPTTRRLMWNHAQWGDYEGRFESVKALCDIGSLVMPSSEVLLWEFPSEFLRCFQEVWVATYMFDASPFAAYLSAEGFAIERFTVSAGNLTPWNEGADEAALKARLRGLVTVYEGKANDPWREGPKKHPLSASWFKRQPEATLNKLKASTSNFFRNVAKTRGHQNAWSTWRDHRRALRGEGYSRDSSKEGRAYGFLASNAKATNDYANVASMAYLCNVFYHPVVKAYFEGLGVAVSDDLFALSQLVQWVWRSRIRRGETISLFIPSERMRVLFKRWLAADSTPALIQAIINENMPGCDGDRASCATRDAEMAVAA